MGRPTAIEPQITGRINQPRAEVIVPKPVDDDTGRKRMMRGGDPVSQGPAAVPFRRGFGKVPLRPQSRHASRSHLFARLEWISAEEPVGRCGVNKCAGIADHRFGKRGITETPDLALTMPHSGEYRLDGVVITLRDGIELVIVAAGAADGHPQKRRASRAHHVVEFIGTLIGREGWIGRGHPVCGAPHQKSRGGIGATGVAADLFPDELVVGLVGVERLDHPVAVGPGIGAGRVDLEAIALGKPHHIKPVPGPALAIMRRGKQRVDHAGKRFPSAAGSSAGLHERGQLLGRGRQADEIEHHSTEECSRFGLRIEFQSLLRELLGEKGIDRVGALRASRHCGTCERLKCPMTLTALRRVGRRSEQGVWQGSHRSGPDSTRFNPLPQQKLFRSSQRRAVGRHPAFGISRRDPLEKRACLRLVRQNGCCAGIATGKGPCAGINPISALGPAGAMAGAAARRQQGSDLIGKQRRRGGLISRTESQQMARQDCGGQDRTPDLLPRLPEEFHTGLGDGRPFRLRQRIVPAA